MTDDDPWRRRVCSEITQHNFIDPLRRRLSWPHEKENTRRAARSSWGSLGAGCLALAPRANSGPSAEDGVGLSLSSLSLFSVSRLVTSRGCRLEPDRE